MSRPVLIVGAGAMGVAYTRVLMALGYQPTTVCRSPTTAETYQKETGIAARPGGLSAYLDGKEKLPNEAIVAVDVDQLAAVTETLVKAGVRRILVEKPGGLNGEEVSQVARTAAAASAAVLIGYNRRFYASTRRAAEMVVEDGGVCSAVFDFTEVSRIVPQLKQAPIVKAAWVLANSSHVIDLAFFLAGAPTKLECQVEGSLPWHPSAAAFSGFGRTERGAVFSYHADWRAPARWSVEVRTPLRRLILCPLETLKVQTWDGFDLREEPLDNAVDRTYKPGLYHQVKAFLTGEGQKLLPSIEEQAKRVRQIYEPIAHGKRSEPGE
jgi:predicted dehydrogenase